MRKAELQRRYDQAVEERDELAKECARLTATVTGQTAVLAENRATAELVRRHHDEVVGRMQRELDRLVAERDALRDDLHRYAGIDETPVTGRSAYTTEDDEIRKAAEAAAALVSVELAQRGVPEVL